jgi:hypothetical protein
VGDTQGLVKRLVLVGALALAAAGCGGTTTTTVTVTQTVTQTMTTTRTVTTTGGGSPAAACTGTDLSATFTGVPGSAGAGTIVYRLKLKNTSQAPCWVSGLPQAQLLDANGSPLPTHVIPSHRGVGTAARLVLQPADSATAEARFSPDVPGQGDNQSGACQPKAETLRVTPNGGGTVDAPIQPPTRVCEQGQLQFDLLARA